MKISGFTFIRNATKLYLPFRESVLSVLPLVDEFVIALGDCDPDDGTAEIIQEINTPKIKVIPTVWDYQKYPKGAEFAHQTDIAKAACSGDWLFYIQGDEVIHEDDYDILRRTLDRTLKNSRVEGLLFRYLHFFGDYWHVQNTHGWYRNEIRMIRNDSDIHSWRDAQSFRRIPNFDGVDYYRTHNTEKLWVVDSGARIFHYGWVKPPSYVVNKEKELHVNYQKTNPAPQRFDYGPIGILDRFAGTHPAVMKDWIEKFSWRDQLNYTKVTQPGTGPYKYASLRNRIHTFFEERILGGRTIGGFKNYKKLGMWSL